MFIISIMIIIFNQELVKEVVGLRRSVEEQGKKLADLENYIDTLVRTFSRMRNIQTLEITDLEKYIGTLANKRYLLSLISHKCIQTMDNYHI